MDQIANDNVQYFELNNGAKMPSIGLGTWQAQPGVVAEAIAIAIKAGYRHIDCAYFYGNEKEFCQLIEYTSTSTSAGCWIWLLRWHANMALGSTADSSSYSEFSTPYLKFKIGTELKKLFEDGVVKREDLWITSKLWCCDHAPEDVPKAMDRTLQDLQIDYVDLYLMHWPVRTKKGFISLNPEDLLQPDIPSTWKAMEALYDSGKARIIGVSNFSVKKLQDLLKVARVTPAVNQVECHPGWRQEKLHEFCKSKGIHVSGYSPMGSPGSPWFKSDVLKHAVIKMVAEKLGKTPGQVCIRWVLQMGYSVLPKSANEARIKENFDVFGWCIPEDLFAKFSEIEQAKLFTMEHFFVHETYGPYKSLEELWDGEI